jgi:hypothetical protein
MQKPALARRAPVIAVVMLSLMTALMFTSAWDDTPNSDDNVALISGYSYLRKQEYRLEPQNPPLIKDLGALPLLFMNLREPWDQPGWGDNNDPDDLGKALLYRLGNDPDAILRAARAPMIVFAAAFGGLLFWWTLKHFGDGVALLTLFLYAFSPTFLAHGRFIATDVGATAGFFVAVVAYLHYLKHPGRRGVLLAALAMGFAFLTKFSTVALIPIVLFLGVMWVVATRIPVRRSALRLRGVTSGLAVTFRPPGPDFFRALGRVLAQTAGIILLAHVVIYPLYLHHIWNYDPARQVMEARIHRDLYGMGGTAKDIVIWASDKSVLRPWAEYFLGLLVALKASNWGQPIFFWGQIHPTGLRVYFPFVYLVKEPLTLHLLTLAAVVFTLCQHRKSRGGRRPFWRAWLAEHFTEFAFLVVIAVYWTALIRSNMNIGVRHLLPAFPFMFVLISRQIVSLYRRLTQLPAQWRFRAALGALLLWQAVSVLRVHPSYLAYFNELAGGPDGGWRYVNDSNLDWGQDVKRLAQFVEERGIERIHFDYFGPADASYYLQDKFQGSLGCKPPQKGWAAISAMVYPGAPWQPHCDYRHWLPIDQAVAKIGHSIFIFRVD